MQRSIKKAMRAVSLNDIVAVYLWLLSNAELMLKLIKSERDVCLSGDALRTLFCATLDFWCTIQKFKVISPVCR